MHRTSMRRYFKRNVMSKFHLQFNINQFMIFVISYDISTSLFLLPLSYPFLLLLLTDFKWNKIAQVFVILQYHIKVYMNVYKFTSFTECTRFFPRLSCTLYIIEKWYYVLFSLSLSLLNITYQPFILNWR